MKNLFAISYQHCQRYVVLKENQIQCRGRNSGLQKNRTRARSISAIAANCLISGILLILFVAPSSAFAHWHRAAGGDLGPDEIQNSSIYGVVWVDLNRNSTWEEKEPLVAGKAVFVTPDIESDFAQVLVLFTNEQGEFNATNLSPGRYRLWTADTVEESATVIHLTADRSVMTVQLPLVGFTLFMPQVVR